MRNNNLGYNETAKRFGIRHKQIQDWERIYLEEGPESLYIERRGRACSSTGVRKGRPPKFDKKVEEDLIAENQRLRAEVDYLKKLNALVLEEERRDRRRK
jgi:transposase